MGKVHHITFATGNSRVTGLPYSITQKLLVDSIQDKTKRVVIHHTHDLESMKAQSWFYKIAHFPSILIGDRIVKQWRRDGYFCAYKALFANELLDAVDDGDLIYWTDSSAYYREPFTENLDRFFDYVDYSGGVCGSHGYDVKHSSFGCLTDTNVWKLLWPDSEKYMPGILEHLHILASWYCVRVDANSRAFIREWSRYITDVKIGDRPVITMHHTVDQSLFNILTYKYGFRSFFNNTIHDHNKNHNNVHRFVNAQNIQDISDLDIHFPKPIEWCAR